ncbi:MAG: hypothetical protein L0211_14330 [Planctomycetaceae bacterium]|nr:hypothetical protein [Planctomycetaceae bacterium]
MFSSLMLAAVLVAVPTRTTPVEVLAVCRFNAALADETLMHHLVELTAVVTEIERDGIGGYIVRLDAEAHESDFIGRVEIHCHFVGTARPALAGIKPGEAVTIRGVPRELRDHLSFPLDKNVRIKMKDCELLVAAP